MTNVDHLAAIDDTREAHALQAASYKIGAAVTLRRATGRLAARAAELTPAADAITDTTARHQHAHDHRPQQEPLHPQTP